MPSSITWLPPDLDEAAVVRAAAVRGVAISGVRPYRITSKGPGGLIFGYAALNERAITEGIAILASVIDDLRSA